MERFVAYLPPLLPTLVVVAVIVSLLAVTWLGRRDARPLNRIHHRLIFGIPWGTLVLVVSLLVFYLFVQQGWSHWDAPVTFPFTAWSYLYPAGHLTAGFAHATPGHLLSNLLGLLLLGSLAEYVWGHYPVAEVDRPRDPWIRALVCFPLAAVVVALVSVLFAWSPVIGFSGVVFALAGFTVVRFPIATVVLLAFQGVVGLVARALAHPTVVWQVERTLDPPGWVGIAAQGHAFGFLIGATIGLWLLYRRPVSPPAPWRLWLGIVITGSSMGLWAIWGGVGDDTFVLHRALGVTGVFLLSIGLTAAAHAGNEELGLSITPRHVMICLVCLPLLTMVVAAVPLNLYTVADHEPPDAAVTDGGYTVYYGVDVEMRWTTPAVSWFVDERRTTTDGVIVINERQEMQTRQVSSQELAIEGEDAVTIGGIGWRNEIGVKRDGWRPVGNDTVYRVRLEHDGTDYTSFAADDRVGSPRIAGYAVGVAVTDGEFELLVVGPDGATQPVAMLEEDERTAVGKLELVRENDRITARHEATNVTVATKE